MMRQHPRSGLFFSFTELPLPEARAGEGGCRRLPRGKGAADALKAAVLGLAQARALFDPSVDFVDAMPLTTESLAVRNWNFAALGYRYVGMIPWAARA
jgi:hypothetical protein